MSLNNTTRTVNMYRFLTEKIKAGKLGKIDLLTLLENLGYSGQEEKYQTLINEAGERVAMITFMYDLCGFTPFETMMLANPLESETTSYIYKKIYEGHRLNLRLSEMNLGVVKELYE